MRSNPSGLLRIFYAQKLIEKKGLEEIMEEITLKTPRGTFNGLLFANDA
jgi:hypothetical protein